MRPLSTQTVLITGASSGIGEATACRLAAAGARLVLTARRAERLTELARELDASGARVLAVPGDLTLAADRERIVAAGLEKFGRLDGLVNNAGYGTRGPLELVPVEAVRRNYEVNIFSLLALTQLALPHLRATRGCVVNIGSVAGRISRPLTSVYDSTKHALEALTDGLRGEVEPMGVRVTLIRPGFIATEFVEAANAVSANLLGEPGPYAPYLGSFEQRATKLRRVAGRPDCIARLVAKALEAERPRARYAAPCHAKIFLFLNWMLPRSVVAWMTRMRRVE